MDETGECFYPLNPRVKKIQQSLSFGITREGNIMSRKLRLLSDVLKLRKMLKAGSFDFFIATEYPFAIAAILAGAKKMMKIFAWEHHHFYELEKNGFWERLFKLAYPKLHGIVTLNPDEARLFSKLNRHVIVIPNMVFQKQLQDNPRLLRLLTIARLAHVKGIDLLLPLAKNILQKNPGWTWKLIGDGDMKNTVEEFIEKEGLQDRLILQPPLGSLLDKEYGETSIYVMTSRNECLPMTLLEAMSMGLPCVAFDCETGPRHIIKNGINGLLVEEGNILKLEMALELLIHSEEKRKLMGEAAMQSMKEFDSKKILQAWEKLFFPAIVDQP
jgi:glycosyltransferase involved in cell wall biosynthesis